MKTQTKPTPHMLTPWKCDVELDHEDYRIRNTSGLTVAHCGYKEHAAFIVRAVNAYERDQEIKKELLENLKNILARFSERCVRTGCNSAEEMMLKSVKQAIAKAEGR